jgi:hypothetical protein
MSYMDEPIVHLPLSEVERILIRCWDLLSPDTQAQLKTMGIKGDV